jgi:hypothetical protein
MIRCLSVSFKTSLKGRVWAGLFRLEPDRMLAAILYRDPTLGGVHNGGPLLEVLQRVADPEVELHTASDENEMNGTRRRRRGETGGLQFLSDRP